MSITTITCRRLTAVALAAAGCLGVASAQATVAYQNAATTLATPPNISYHNTAGPVIADDFVPVVSGNVTQLTWWGSAAGSDTWEVVFQNNDPALGQPAITPAGNTANGGVKAFLTATGVAQSSIPGLFMYTADFSTVGSFHIDAGTDYWLTIANTANDWNWAEALGGPTIGSENFNAHQSVGPGCDDGGPHCGPWTDIHTDFAMQIAAIPEPGPLTLMLGGLGVVGYLARRRQAA